MNVLIITYTGDNNCIKTVTESIEAKGGKVYRFNTDKYPTQYMMKAEFSAGKTPSLRLSGPNFDINLSEDIDAIWYRRIRIGGEFSPDMDRQLRIPSIAESKSTFYGMLNSLGKFTFDPFTKMRYAENKQMQLQLAQQVGLEIPETLITNDADAVKAFYNRLKKPLITKMQHAFAVYRDGDEQVVFTNEIGEKDMDDLEGLNICPMQFQEKVEKKLELRITVVGDKVFAAAIDSKSLKGSELDWRREGHNTLQAWVPYELPEDIKNKLLQMMEILGLNYGAADILLTPDDRYLFLEINPAGEFFWIDMFMDNKISDAIADVLLGRGKRRTNNIITPFEEVI